jgi:hypothetical protein
VRGFGAGHAGLLTNADLILAACLGQLAGLGVVAARADRGVGSEEKLTPLQPITGSGPLVYAKREAAASHWILHCLPNIENSYTVR